jgi:hypothetical protein
MVEKERAKKKAAWPAAAFQKIGRLSPIASKPKAQAKDGLKNQTFKAGHRSKKLLLFK